MLDVASAEVRAERRHKELLDRGEASIYARVLQEMRERDARDTTRDVAPLKPAEDAILLDTSEMDADAAFATAVGYIETMLGACILFEIENAVIQCHSFQAC